MPEGWMDPPETYEPAADPMIWLYAFELDPPCMPAAAPATTLQGVRYTNHIT